MGSSIGLTGFGHLGPSGDSRARTPRTFLDPLNTGVFGMNAYERNAPQRAAEEAEARRRAGIADATNRINTAFDAPGRQQQYTDFLSALRDRFQTDLGRQHANAKRQTKFSIARGGLTGGSADVSANRTVREDFEKGVLTAEDRAQSALASLKAGDESSRLNLIQLAQQGLDATTAAARANQAASQSTQGALADAATRGLGDMFGATADIYRRQQESAGRREAQRAPIGSLYGTKQ